MRTLGPRLLAVLMSAPRLRRPGITIRILSACPEVTTPPQFDARPPHPCQMTRCGNGAQRGPRPGAALRP
eukprot:1588693-Prymnesium_polylepis.1